MVYFDLVILRNSLTILKRHNKNSTGKYLPSQLKCKVSIRETKAIPLKPNLIRSCHQMFSTKKTVFKDFAIFTEKQLCWSLFLIKLKAFRAAALLKRDFCAVVILWIWRTFKEHLFWRTSGNSCFCLMS